jgi:hypothetical protein
MQLGSYYNTNQNRIATLNDADWRIALAKCKTHIRWKLKQKTLSGAHASSNLGADPVDYYLGFGYEKILSGEWEWKAQYSLAEQMIRIINSQISKEVEKTKSAKAASFKIVYMDIEEELYELIDSPSDADEAVEYEKKLQSIEAAVKGDEHLELLLEALKEGMKRTAIADLLGMQPKQMDKLKEKLFRRIRSYQPN